MRLGIDFGTTRIVVAAVDRGNYPVAAFECPDGASREWIPPLIAVRGETRLYGWDAWAAQGTEGVLLIRSIKRVLADAGPETRIDLGTHHLPMNQLLTELLGYVRNLLLHHSSLPVRENEPLEVMLGVPANANSNQRFLTAEGFRQAGFTVIGLLNEPSAASIEYAHRLAADDSKAPERVLVYDLGGGTFDVSLVLKEDRSHTVAATEGIPTLGGDDFDEFLAELALEKAGYSLSDLNGHEEFLLLEECREKKESLHPNTRRLIVDLDSVREGWPQVAVPVGEFFDRCQPLVQETLHATQDLLQRVPEGESVSLYITGGASELPLIGRQLREEFGRRVKRSAYTRSATAIGLAIQADAQSAYQLRERFTRFFGVWRESEAGRVMLFDPLFERGLELPGPGEPPLERVRRYSPVHNVGHFRYLECSSRGPQAEPTGDVTAWDEIRFPFDPALAELDDLTGVPVAHGGGEEHQMIEEQYTADASGAVLVRISNLTAGYERKYRLGRWAADERPVQQVKSRKRAARKG
jgi:molecular chaperone DnaK (HSP70)